MRVFVLICALMLPLMSFAQTAPSTEEVELRARDVGNALRCVVCQNQSIEESEATLAKDMRVIVRERIASGESDAQVIEFMRERYGDYVLLKPPLQRNTALLWFLPAIVIMGMALWFFARVRQRPRPLAPRQSLSADDEITLKRLMDDSS